MGSGGGGGINIRIYLSISCRVGVGVHGMESKNELEGMVPTCMISPKIEVLFFDSSRMWLLQ